MVIAVFLVRHKTMTAVLNVLSVGRFYNFKVSATVLHIVEWTEAEKTVYRPGFMTGIKFTIPVFKITIAHYCMLKITSP